MKISTPCRDDSRRPCRSRSSRSPALSWRWRVERRWRPRRAQNSPTQTIAETVDSWRRDSSVAATEFLRRRADDAGSRRGHLCGVAVAGRGTASGAAPIAGPTGRPPGGSRSASPSAPAPAAGSGPARAARPARGRKTDAGPGAGRSAADPSPPRSRWPRFRPPHRSRHPHRRHRRPPPPPEPNPHPLLTKLLERLHGQAPTSSRRRSRRHPGSLNCCLSQRLWMFRPFRCRRSQPGYFSGDRQCVEMLLTSQPGAHRVDRYVRGACLRPGPDALSQIIGVAVPGNLTLHAESGRGLARRRSRPAPPAGVRLRVSGRDPPSETSRRRADRRVGTRAVRRRRTTPESAAVSVAARARPRSPGGSCRDS